MTRHSERPRDYAYMTFVRGLPCLLRGVDGAGECEGAVEADHAGCRFKQGDGRRAFDWTCIPLCHRHHLHRTVTRGYFAPHDRGARMVWRQLAIGATLHRWRRAASSVIPF